MTHLTSSSRSGMWGRASNGRASRRRGFTLLQIMVVVGLIALLAAILIGQFGRTRESARRLECDAHLKGIVLAIDTFRQENNRLPLSLRELQTKGYLTPDVLRCPSDPDLSTRGGDPNYISYADDYILRDARDSGELPVVVCPFHEKEGAHGAQGFKGGFTQTFAARPATLGGISGSVTVTRPGQGVLAIPASGQLPVRGGDRIKVGAGTALLSFADGSQATLSNNSEMSVLQSYMAGQTSDSLYTLVRQFAGTISYSVVSGNKFDVATPTATAGALGTKFTIQIVAPLVTQQTTAVNPNSTMQLPQEALLTVQVHAVAFTCHGRTVTVSQDEPGVRSDDPELPARAHTPRDSHATSFGASSAGNSAGNSTGGGSSNGSNGSGNNGGNNGNGNGNNGNHGGDNSGGDNSGGDNEKEKE